MISKSVTSQPGKQAITIHILPDFSESKGNQKIQYDQLIKQEKYFSSKFMQKTKRETNSNPLFIF